MSPRGELGGDLLALLPWVLGAVGVLLTLLAAFVTDDSSAAVNAPRSCRTDSKRSPRRTPSSTCRNATSRSNCSAASCPGRSPTSPGSSRRAPYEAGVKGTEVGGDWYDVLPIAEDRVVFSVGDVCGRGLSAAVLMASLRYSIRAYALEDPDPPPSSTSSPR